MKELMVRLSRCICCGVCEETCPQGAVSRPGNVIKIDREKCNLCGLCAENCYAETLELVGYEITEAELIDQLQKDQVFYDQSGGGVTFSGGEPMLQVRFLTSMLETCQRMNIPTVVDTSGYASWSSFEAVRAYTDLFLYDLKVIDDSLHRKYTGVSNDRILHNLVKLSRTGHKIIVRMPVIPGVNDDRKNILEAGSFLSRLPALEYLELLAYHTIGTEKYKGLDQAYILKDLNPPLEENMLEIVQTLEDFGLQVKYGGS